MGLAVMLLIAIAIPFVFGFIVSLLGVGLFIHGKITNKPNKHAKILILGGLGIILLVSAWLFMNYITAVVNSEMKYLSVPNKIVVENDKDYGDSFRLEGEYWVEASFLDMPYNLDEWFILTESDYNLEFSHDNIGTLYEIDYTFKPYYSVPFDLYYTNLGNRVFCKLREYDEILEYYTQYEPEYYDYNDEPVWGILDTDRLNDKEDYLWE